MKPAYTFLIGLALLAHGCGPSEEQQAEAASCHGDFDRWITANPKNELVRLCVKAWMKNSQCELDVYRARACGPKPQPGRGARDDRERISGNTPY